MELIELDFNDLQVKLEQLDTYNPWAVTDPSVFLNYNCPECDFKSNKLQTFSTHGLENHVKSSVLFKSRPKDYDANLVKENIDTLNQVIQKIQVTNQDPEIVQDFEISELEKSNVLQQLLQVENEINNTKRRKKKKVDDPFSNLPLIKSEEIIPSAVEIMIEVPSNHDFQVVETPVFDQEFKVIGSVEPTDIFSDDAPDLSDLLGEPIIDQEDLESKHTLGVQQEVEVQDETKIMSKQDGVKIEVIEPDPEQVHWNWKNVITVTQNQIGCKKCPETFESKVKAVKHMMKEHLPHASNKYEVCQSCVEPLRDLRTFRAHNYAKHPKAPNFWYKCNICSYDADSIFIMNDHYKRVHQDCEFVPFICDSCDETFNIYEELLEHEAEQHDIKHRVFNCSKCPLAFRSEKNFMIHDQVEHDNDDGNDNYRVMCFYCETVFDSEVQTIEHHFQNHIKKLPYLFKCDFCDEIFNSLKSIEAHCQAVHDTNYMFKCNQCDKTFAQHTKLVQHLITHKEVPKVRKKVTTPSICDTCGYSCKWPARLKRHKETVHGEGGTMKVCELCGFSTVSSVKYRYHQSTHNKKHQCPYCEKSFVTNAKAEIHIDRMHPSTAPPNFTCEYCPSVFIYENSLKMHKFSCAERSDYQAEAREKSKSSNLRKYTQHNPAINTFGLKKQIKYQPRKCDYCDKMLTKARTIKTHYLLEHPGREIILEGTPRFPCKECGAEFFGNGLNVHMVKKHGIKSRLDQKICEKCKMGYVHNHTCGGANRSMRGDYKCSVCGMKIAHYASLMRHMKVIHSNERHYCDICSKKCTSKEQLYQHIKQCHSNVTCDICQKTIRNASDLKRHKAMVHNESAYFCNVCPRKRLFLTRDKYEKHMQEEH